MERLSILTRRLLITLSVLFCPLILQAQVPHSLVQSIPPPLSGPQEGGQLGVSVAVDGDYTVTSAPYHNDAGGTKVGVVKVLHSSTGAQLFVLSNPAPAICRNFGFGVAVSGTKVIVGAPLDSTGATNAGRAFVYDLSGATPTVPILTLNNPSPSINDYFGNFVAISGNRVVVSAWQDDTGELETGIAYVYDLDSATSTVPILTLNNPTPARNDYFGHSVAISGSRVVIGAYQDDVGASNAGSAYIYDLMSATPAVPALTINNPNPAASDQFGICVAISGTRLVIGANLDDTGTMSAGSAYVYDLNSANPTAPIQTLNNPEQASSYLFGRSVAISDTSVVVGAYLNPPDAYTSGRAYVFNLTSPTPAVPTTVLNNPTPSADDRFGSSVAISGTKVIVGAYQDDTGATDAGSVYIFDLTNATPSVPIAKLNDPGPAEQDNFGRSVGISGTLFVVGAYLDRTKAVASGTAYVYDLASATPTVPIATLNNPSPAVGDYFAYSVAISGTRIVVGCYQDNTGVSNAGSAYVYDLSSATPSEPILTLNNPSPAQDDYFGICVAISGTRVVVGAHYDDTEAINAGSAYVYDLNSATPTVPIATMNNPSPANNDWFGSAVAISGTKVVVGAYQDDTGATDSGSAYVYDLNSATPTVPALTLNKPVPQTSDQFGRSVAISGSRVAIGTWLDNTGAVDAGRVYVYDLTSATPTTPTAVLNNPSPEKNDWFGFAVAISDSRLIVGANNDSTGALSAGSAYVYDLTSAFPSVPIATINNPTPAQSDYFGRSVAISGTSIAIGANYDDSVAMDKGYAYIYEPTPTPDIAVAQAGTLTDGGTISFGNVNLGSSSSPRIFTISNPSPGTLSNLALTGSTSEFTLTPLSGTSIPAGADSVSFAVTFTPSSAGMKSTTLHLASNVLGLKNPFDIQLIGTGNLPPTFSGYTLQATQGNPTSLFRNTLLARAADANGGPRSLSSVSAASTQGGSVFVGGEEINYSPPANFTGLDTFTVTIADGQGGSVEGNVMVVVTANGAPMGKLPMIMLQPSGKVAILFDGIPSQGYRIERSPDLLNWSPLQTTTAPTDGMLPYFDINPLPGQGFYRRIPQ